MTSNIKYPEEIRMADIDKKCKKIFVPLYVRHFDGQTKAALRHIAIDESIEKEKDVHVGDLVNRACKAFVKAVKKRI